MRLASGRGRVPVLDSTSSDASRRITAARRDIDRSSRTAASSPSSFRRTRRSDSMPEEPGPRGRKSRVIIVEDHSLTRAGLRLALEEAGFEVVGEADDGLRGWEAVDQLEPDV